MMRTVRKYRMLLQVAAVVSWIRVRLRIAPLPAVLTRLDRSPLSGAPDQAGFEDLVYYLDRWLQLFPYNKKGNCFPRSLALYWFAKRSGYSVSFHCGVRKDASGLDGHAWLMRGCQPFYEPGRHWEQFTITYSFPPDQPVTQQPEKSAAPGKGSGAVI